MAVCSTVCLGPLMAVGTAQLPGDPLPDGCPSSANSAVTMVLILYAATPL